MIVIKRLSLFVFAFALAFAFSGCETLASSISSSGTKKSSKEEKSLELSPDKLNQKVTMLATQLFSNLKDYDYKTRSLVVTTFVDMDSLNRTSRFGRYVSERLGQILHKMDFLVFEIRQAKWIRVIKKMGEFNLTREAKALFNRYRADAVIVGTYILVDGELTLHVRMLERDTSRVVSVASETFRLADDPYLKKLIVHEEVTGVEVKTALVPLEE